MGDKKTFGEYISQKRREAGFTQKSFADRLFVTESAVSKWERGLSFPDITLIGDICEALGISEHELLTASEDTEARVYEKQAQRYRRLVKRYQYTLIFLYGLSLLICLICNIAVQHTLSWFFLVLTSELVAASLTLLPVLAERKAGMVTLGGFTLSLLLLLLTCGIYTGGAWFPVAAVSVLFGLSVVFLPVVMNAIYLPGFLSDKKTLLCFSADTLLLFLLLLVCSLYTRGGWFFSTAVPIAAFSLALPWAMMLIIRYTRINGFYKTAGCFAVTSVFDYYVNGVINGILEGGPYGFGFRYDFQNWSGPNISGNVNAIVFFTLLGMAVLFAAAGIVMTMRNSKAGAEKAG